MAIITTSMVQIYFFDRERRAKERFLTSQCAQLVLNSCHAVSLPIRESMTNTVRGSPPCLNLVAAT